MSKQVKEPKTATRTSELAKKGEDAAASFLIRRGYEIIDRNWKCHAGEIDIIAKDENCLVFCDVKTRRSADKGFPSEAVSAKKRERFEKIALAYCMDIDETDFPIRFDIISIVVLAPERALVRHTINAFSR